jgi:hypothetical protein
MSDKFKVPAGIDENGRFVEEIIYPEIRLQRLNDVVGVMMRDALNTWADIWEELQDSVVTRGGFVLPEAEKGFKPKCGWPEFLEKLWLLNHQLGFTKRLCENQ